MARVQVRSNMIILVVFVPYSRNEQRVQRPRHLPTQQNQIPMQAVRASWLFLHSRPLEDSLQGVQGRQYLRARSNPIDVQSMQRGGDMCSRQPQIYVQTVCGGAAYVSTVAFGASAKTAVEVRYASTASRGALVSPLYPDFRNHTASRRYHCRRCRGAGFCRRGKRRYRSTCQLCAKTPDQPISRFKNQRIESNVRTGLPR
jgi:hypothetical protein